MTTTLVLRFPWGRYHATPWGRHVNEAAIEWPPSPWRLLRAFFATWKCRVPELDATTVHDLLDALSEPPTYVVPDYVEAHTRHYMPDIDHRRGAELSTDKVIDAFTVFERGSEIVVTWADDLPVEQRAALERLAAQLPYVGRAESVCEAALAGPDADSMSQREGTVISPIADGEAVDDPLRLLVPSRPLDVDALTARTTEVRRQRLLAPPGTYWREYRAPVPASPSRPTRHRRRERPTAFRWAVSSPANPSVKATVAMADTLRRACMGRFGAVSVRPDGSRPASETLAGKDADGIKLAGHRHAHYLALDTDSDRLIDTFVLWAPAGLGDAEADAAAGLSHLRGGLHVPDFRPCRLGLVAAGEIGDVAPELVGPARVWRSFTPFAPARFGRRRQPWPEHVVHEVGAELGYRGFPSPMTVELLPGDWLDFRRHRPRERLQDGRRAVGIRIEFAEPVGGPLALGALSHFGLGLFVPM